VTDMRIKGVVLVEPQRNQALGGLTSYGCHRDGTPATTGAALRYPSGRPVTRRHPPITTDITALQQEGIPDVGLGIGETFPEVVLPAVSDGQPMSLAAFRGEKLFLHLFASW